MCSISERVTGRLDREEILCFTGEDMDEVEFKVGLRDSKLYED